MSTMKNSVLDQSGHLHSRCGNNVRKDCCEWSAVTCRNDKTSSVQVFNCQGLNLQGGVKMNSRERNCLRKHNRPTSEDEQLQQLEAPPPFPALLSPQPARQLCPRSATPENHSLGKRNHALDEEQLEAPQMKRLRNNITDTNSRKVEEHQTEYYRADWTVLPTDSGLNDVGVSTQLCNSILLPADYDLIADKFPTFEEHVAGARTRCYEALTFVTALEQRMDFWRQQMARNAEVTEAGANEDGGNK